MKIQKRLIQLIWYYYWIMFILIIGAAFTLDLNRSIYFLPRGISIILTEFMFMSNVVAGILLLLLDVRHRLLVLIALLVMVLFGLPDVFGGF